jgi:hypothetical protein
MQRTHAAHFESGFIAESPAKLARILQYFAALLGRGAFPAVRCNAPEFSTVITATGRVQPCFFIGAPPDAVLSPSAADSLHTVLNSESMGGLRAAIRSGARAECKTCVCSLWREPPALPDSLRLRA